MAPPTDDIRAALEVVLAPPTARGPATDGAHVPDCGCWAKGFCGDTGQPCTERRALDGGCHRIIRAPITCLAWGQETCRQLESTCDKCRDEGSNPRPSGVQGGGRQ